MTAAQQEQRVPNLLDIIEDAAREMERTAHEIDSLLALMRGEGDEQHELAQGERERRAK